MNSSVDNYGIQARHCSGYFENDEKGEIDTKSVAEEQLQWMTCQKAYILIGKYPTSPNSFN
jgi:hypothetical protein